MHVVTFNVFDVHRKGFPDGEYPVKSELTGDREESHLRLAIGFKRIEPLAYYGGALRKDQHLVSLDFAVVLEPLAPAVKSAVKAMRIYQVRMTKGKAPGKALVP